jgi:FG-GAP repeat
VSVLMGGPDATFSAPTRFGAGVLPLSVAVGDLDSDGDQDLITTNAVSGSVSVLLNTTPQLNRPTSKEQCKNSGWRNFPGFKNQGDCVRFVATGGKIPPAGS